MLFCQLANLIYWMTVHTPLTVVERHRHGYDVSPIQIEHNHLVVVRPAFITMLDYIQIGIQIYPFQTMIIMVYSRVLHFIMDEKP